MGSLSTLRLGLSGVLAAVGLDRLVSGMDEFVRSMTELRNLSARTGLPEDVLSRLKYAADQTGVSLEELVRAFEKFQMAKGTGLPGFIEYAAGAKPSEETRKMFGEELAAKFLQAARQDLAGLLRQAPALSAKAIQDVARMGDEMARMGAERDVALAPLTLALVTVQHALATFPKSLSTLVRSMGAAETANLLMTRPGYGREGFVADNAIRQAIVDTAQTNRTIANALTEE